MKLNRDDYINWLYNSEDLDLSDDSRVLALEMFDQGNGELAKEYIRLYGGMAFEG